MSQLVVKCVGSLDRTVDLVSNTVYVGTVKSRWTGKLEEERKKFVVGWAKWVSAGIITTRMLVSTVRDVSAMAMKDPTGADQIRSGFMQIIDVFTAITEPILWFYALTACILMATGKSKDLGWNRLKNVGYAYVFISLLPTFFSFLRWVAKLVGHSIDMQ